MEKTNKSEKIVPPYLSVARLEQLFNLLSTHSFTQVSTQEFVSRGFSKPDSFLVIQALRFLGLITQDNKTTDSLRLLAMRSQDKDQELQVIIREAYKKLFNTIPNAEQMLKDQLHDEFMAVYGVSHRLASPATLAFIWLCKRFGLKPAEEVSPRFVAARESKPGQADSRSSRDIKDTHPYPEKNISLEVHDLTISDTGIRLIIPKNSMVDDAVLSGGLSEVREKIIEFAKKVNLKKDSEDGTKEDI